MSSYCSSEGGLSDSLLSSRKCSLLRLPDDTQVDRELHDVVELFRSANPNSDRKAEIDAALEYCRQQLKELLTEENETVESLAKTTTEVDDVDAEEVDDVLDDMPKILHQEEIEAKKQNYFDKIVQLGLERQNLQDNRKSVENEEIVRYLGHEFVIQSTKGRRNPCCEICMHTIWRLVQTWRRCQVCGLRAHDKCCGDTRRVCSGAIASRDDFFLATTIAEEQSLAAQDYKCAECFSPISFDGTADREARLCDYSGELFCPNCHWNDTWSIPARIVHNLDAKPRFVCRAAKQLLALVDRRPLINIDSSHLSLIKFHKELRKVNELRRNFMLMKCYFISCRTARKLRILQYLNQHSHFVDSAEMYSLRELRELCEGTLLPELEQIHTVFRKHIEEECETCRGNGFFCELCDKNDKAKNELLYPFTEGVRSCAECLAVFHKKCFEKRSLHCPRCERRKKRHVELVEETTSDCKE